MRVVAAIALAAAVAAAALSLSDAATARRARLDCAAERGALKTLSDTQRNLVRIRPKVTSVAAINRLSRPRRTPRTRRTAFQRRVWRVRAQIVEYKLERDAAVHLVLYDGKRSYMTAAMPSPGCLPATTRARRAIAGSRWLVEGLCGPARPSWRPLGAVVLIDGVGFWQAPGDQHGHARNYAELHPVTGVRLIAGCA